MRYDQFKAMVADKGWTLAQLRCDTPPSDDLLELMAVLGLAKYEQFVMRLRKEQEATRDVR